MRRPQNHDSNMLNMIKHFIFKNKFLLGILLVCILGAWYILMEVLSSDGFTKTNSEITKVKTKVVSLDKQAASEEDKGNPRQSLQLLDNGLSLLKGCNLQVLEVKLLRHKAAIQERIENTEGAVYSYLSILKIQENDNPKKTADVRKKLGTIYSKNTYADGLIGLFNPVLKDNRLKEEHPSACLFLATAFMNKQMLDSSFFYMQKAEKIIDRSNTRDYSMLFLLKSNYYLNTGDFTRGIGCLDSAQIIQEITKDTIGLSQTYFTRAMLAYFKDDFKGVTDELQKSVKLLEHINSSENVMSAYFNIAGAYGSLGDTKRENLYYRKGIDLKDSLEFLKKGKGVADYVNNFQYKWKTDEVRQLSEEQRLLTINLEGKQRQKYLLIAIILLICVLLIYGFRLFWAKEKEHQLKEQVFNQDKQIIQAEKELLDKELDMIKKRVEFDAQLISEKEGLISELENKLSSSTLEVNEQTELLTIIESMKEGLKQERESIGLEIMLKEENLKFLKKLKEKHADISQTEARFCTLLYLNLDTKEIARILNISLDGVRKSRHRLRKKLDIGSGGDITNYLQGI